MRNVSAAVVTKRWVDVGTPAHISASVDLKVTTAATKRPAEHLKQARVELKCFLASLVIVNALWNRSSTTPN